MIESRRILSLTIVCILGVGVWVWFIPFLRREALLQQTRLQTELKDSFTIEVLARGEEPRSMLQQDFIAAQEQKVRMRLQTSLEEGANPDTTTKQFPVIEFLLAYQVVRSIDSDSAVISVRLKDLHTERAGESALTALLGEFSSLRGLECNFVLTSYGSVTESSCSHQLISAQNYWPLVNQVVRLLSVGWIVRPQEALGVGASWRVHAAQNEVGSLRFESDILYTIEELAPDDWHISVDMSQQGLSQGTGEEQIATELIGSSVKGSLVLGRDRIAPQGKLQAETSWRRGDKLDALIRVKFSIQLELQP